MKKLALLILLASQAHSTTILNQRIWCTGTIECHGSVVVNNIPKSFEMPFSRANVIINNQKGYEGLQINVGATHTFFIYNSGAVDAGGTLRAKLCDRYNRCFNYTKEVTVGWGSSYSETVYSTISVFRETVGAETITAESHINGYPSDHMYKEAMLLVAPFPYDQ
ncbi:hypothetical protein [Legionella sp.]|uniref:hypothetical protein n=1 Tax=Legionella sp. TaxID=459 RepID=UPI003CBB874A